MEPIRLEMLPIDALKHHDDPVRTYRDEDDFEELVISIERYGVLVPIKARPNSGGYEVVYGHRRLDAASAAGLIEVPTIIQDLDNTEMFAQSLTENIVRSDMLPDEVIEALFALGRKQGFNYEAYSYETGRPTKEERAKRGPSQGEFAKQLGISRAALGAYLTTARAKKEGWAVTQPLEKGLATSANGEELQDARRITNRTATVAISNALGIGPERLEAKREVAKAASARNFSSTRTRVLAEAYLYAENKEEREYILEIVPADRFTSIESMRNHLEFYRDVLKARPKKKKKEKKYPDFPRQVASYLEQTSKYVETTLKAHATIERGYFSPEAARFTIRRLKALMADIERSVTLLEDPQHHA